MLKSIGESKQPYLTPTVVLNQSLCYCGNRLRWWIRRRADSVILGLATVALISTTSGLTKELHATLKRLIEIHEDVVEILLML